MTFPTATRLPLGSNKGVITGAAAAILGLRRDLENGSHRLRKQNEQRKGARFPEDTRELLTARLPLCKKEINRLS